MDNKYTHERISRKAECIQWNGENTDATIEMLDKHKMLGELWREETMTIRKNGWIVHTLYVNHWLVEGMDGVLRFYKPEEFKEMYQPIVKNDELERLRAFARDLYEYAEDLSDDVNSHAYGADIRKIIDYREIPDGRIVGSLKAPE